MAVRHHIIIFSNIANTIHDEIYFGMYPGPVAFAPHTDSQSIYL